MFCLLASFRVQYVACLKGPYVPGSAFGIAIRVPYMPSSLIAGSIKGGYLVYTVPYLASVLDRLQVLLDPLLFLLFYCSGFLLTLSLFSDTVHGNHNTRLAHVKHIMNTSNTSNTQDTTHDNNNTTVRKCKGLACIDISNHNFFTLSDRVVQDESTIGGFFHGFRLFSDTTRATTITANRKTRHDTCSTTRTAQQQQHHHRHQYQHQQHQHSHQYHRSHHHQQQQQLWSG